MHCAAFEDDGGASATMPQAPMKRGLDATSEGVMPTLCSVMVLCRYRAAIVTKVVCC